MPRDSLGQSLADLFDAGAPEVRLHELTHAPVRQRPVHSWIPIVMAVAAVLAIGGVAFFMTNEGLQPVVSQPTVESTPDDSVAWSSLPPVSDPTSSFVYLSNDTDLTVVDVDSATSETLRLTELAPGDPPHRLVRRGDVIAFYGQAELPENSGNLTPAVFTIAPDISMEPSLLAESWFFIPSAHEDRVWVTDLDEDSPETVRALSGVSEIAMVGATTVEYLPTPGGRWPVAALLDGLLFEGEESLELWDPSSSVFIESLPGPFVVATSGNKIASCLICTSVELIDLDNDTQRRIEPRDGWASFAAVGNAFSPDGQSIAVAVAEDLGPWDETTKFGVVLVDFEAGTVTGIPGSETQGGLPAMLSWNTDGSWLFAGASEGLMAYRPSDEAVFRVPVALDAGYLERFLGMVAR